MFPAEMSHHDVAELLVHCNVYHSVPGRNVEGMIHRYSRPIAGMQPSRIHERYLVHAPTPLPPVPFEPGMVVIRHDYDPGWKVIPTPEEAKRVRGIILEMSLDGGVTYPIELLPGETLPVSLKDYSYARLRCSIPTDCWIMSIPK